LLESFLEVEIAMWLRQIPEVCQSLDPQISSLRRVCILYANIHDFFVFSELDIIVQEFLFEIKFFTAVSDTISEVVDLEQE